MPQSARRVLVTGGSRGIGQAIAQRYRREGFDVLAPARAELDLSSADAVALYLSSLRDPIDVLICNAGENKINLLEKIALDDWNRMLQTNLTSSFQLAQSLGPAMAKRGWGRIVNVSSIYGLLARPGRAPYSATKAGLNALTRTLALELGSGGVLVNAVCPGFVETELTRKNNTEEEIRALCAQTALGRMAKPDEIAELVFFLGSDRNTYVTGQTVVADGGFSIQ